MKVRLLRMTDPAVADIAAKCCVSATIPDRAHEDYKHLKAACKAGHLSVLEHISVTFTIEGISRACSHQLVRHRMMSVSQQSQRYVAVDKFGCVVPKSIGNNPVMLKEYADITRELSCLYNIMVTDYNIPAEDARYILPNACTTNMVVTMNLREASHICGLRRCARAQAEIRELATQMGEQIIEELIYYGVEGLDYLFKEQCVQQGRCPEGAKSCGKVKKE